LVFCLLVAIGDALMCGRFRLTGQTVQGRRRGAPSAHFLMTSPSLSKRAARWIGESHHLVAGFQAEFSDRAHLSIPSFPGIDIEESVAAQMLGDRYGSRPAVSLLATSDARA